MNRRTMLKRVGAAGLVAAGAGIATADEDVNVWIDDGGERRLLTDAELAGVDTSSCCDYEGTPCCEEDIDCECDCFCCCCGCT